MLIPSEIKLPKTLLPKFRISVHVCELSTKDQKMYMVAVDTGKLAEPGRFKLFRMRLYFCVCSPESRPDGEGFNAIVLLESPILGSRSEEQREKNQEIRNS